MPSYNNYYPATYQSPVMYPQYSQATMPQVQIPQSQPQNNGNINWVQGEVGARAYPVAPSNSVLLMDSDEPRFYIKTADASGMPMPLRVFSYTEEVASQQSHETPKEIDTSNFITREEFEQLEERLTKVKKEK